MIWKELPKGWGETRFLQRSSTEEFVGVSESDLENTDFIQVAQDLNVIELDDFEIESDLDDVKLDINPSILLEEEEKSYHDDELSQYDLGSSENKDIQTESSMEFKGEDEDFDLFIVEDRVEIEPTSNTIIDIKNLEFNWTGSDVCTLFFEFVKEKPTFNVKQVYRNGFKATLILSPHLKTLFDPLYSKGIDVDFLATTKNDAKDATATFALHLLNCGDLYIRMAPPFRDLFKKWKTYEFDQAEKKIQSNAEELNDFINNLLTKTPNFSSKNIKVVSETKIPKERSKSVFSREEYAKKIDSIGYREYEQIRKHLPAYSKKQDLVKMINENRVVIISGETGSGKSTQVPQFIFEDCVSRGVEFNLICTEPRRISAISLASRVSIELNDRLGNLVGYQVKNDSRKSQNTRITYCTTGLFLKQIDDISDVTHIVVDEVHERTLDSDFLLCLLKKLDVKIILMSASADSIKFSEYFGGAPVFVIPGKAYEVQDFYLEHVVGVTNYNSVDDEYSNREYNEVVVKGKGGKVYESGEKYEKKILDVEDIVDMMDMRKINYELISLLVKHIVVFKPAGSSVNDSESILIFLPGIHEIQRLYDVLSNDFAESPTQKHRLLILQLHGQMSNEKQSQVFDPPASGYTKVVLSTNVAETGITIPDIVYVIDTMTAREISFDQKRGINRLLTVPISKANAKQRKGRAGRTKPGISYHLIPKHQFQKLLSQRPPESVRLPIEEICLKYKVFRKGGLLEMFMEMIDPPPKKHIDTAILLLRHLEAFDHEENLTEIGMFLAKMPMDVRLGKLVLYGIFFKCLDPILVVCAAISFGKSPFETKPTNEFATLSDFESLVLIWRNFEKLEKNEKYKFCKKWFLDVGIMIGIGENRVQIMQALEQTRLFKGLKADRLKFGSHNLYGDVKDIVSAAFGCGLYPNIIFLPGNEPIYMLRHPDTKVIVHQGSVLSNQIAKIKTPTYFTYYSIQLKKSISGKTQATVHDLSKIHLLPLILLGCLTLVYKPVQGVLVMDDIVVNCDPKQGALACMLRERLKYLLLGLCRGETPDIDDLIKILEN